MQKIISILLFVIFICNLFYLCSSEDFKYCTDPKCSGPLSEAVTKLTYNAPNLHSLSFAKNMKVKVFSKLKGSEENHWGIEFNGKRGYAPSSFLREVRLIHKIPPVKVPYNIPDDLFPAIPVKGNSENAVKTDIPAGITDEIPTPQNVLSPHEVVDGTTLYLDPEDNIISPTENSVESTFTDKPDFISNNEYEDEEEDWDLEYNDVRDMKNENKETSAEALSETIAKENFESKSETDSKNIESDLRSIETQNLAHSDEVNNATFKQSDIENNADIQENSTFNDANIENNLESESNNFKKETESITEIDKNVTVSPEPSADASELLTSEHDKVSEVKSSSEVSSESIVDNSKQEPLEELVNNMTNSGDSNVETKEDNSEIKNPLLNINSEVKSDEVKNTETTTDGKVTNLDDNSEVKSDENASTFTDDSALNSEDNSKVKHDETVGVPNNDISLDSKVNIPNVIESVEYSSSMKVNPNSNTIDSINDPRPFDSSETIETTTDNTTAYSYKPEEISESKNEQQPSVDTVILSPEIIDDSILSHKQDSQHDANPTGSDSEKQPDNLVNLSSDRQHIASDGVDVSNSEKQPDNLVENLSSDRQHIASDGVDVSNSPNKFDSHQFPNSINILDQLNNALPTNNIESNTKKHLENSQEDITKSEEHFHFENFVMDSDEKKNEVPNLDNANSDSNVVTENSNGNVLIKSEENGISDVMSDVNLEQADFLTTVYEFFGIYQSKEPEVELASGSDFSNVESRSIIGDNEEVYSKKEEFVCKNSNSENIYSLQQFEIPESTYGIIIYLTITAITVLIFTLGYYYIEKLRQDGTLVKRINELEKALLNSNKEKNILRNELELSQGAEAPISLLEKLRDELEESNRLRIELEEQNVNLERELETATEAGLELNKMLGEYLSSQQSGNLVEESLEYLQKQLNDQQLTIAEMTVSANEKAKEFESNLAELNIAKEKITELTSELNSLVVNFTKLQEDSYTRETQLNEQITMLKTQLEKEINEKNQEINEKNNELNQIRQLSKELQHDLNVKENEFLLLKENLKSKKGGENSVESIIDNTHIRAELKEVNAEKELLIKQLEAEIERKKTIENQLTQMVAEKDNLHSQLQNVEKEKIETQTRLEVLSAYFKEKETQLQKELAKHEELWSQNQGQANSTVERIKLLQEEIQNYKTQNEMLRNEIVDQEVSLKSQISVMEKKNHENWLLLRQTERRLEESKHECSQLRNRLTIVEKNLSSEDKSQFRVVSPPLNGDISTSPIHMIEPPVSSPLLFPHRDNMPTTPSINFMGLPPPPPPPGALPFMPPPPPGVPFMPPPPTLFPGDRRPPPLGRMSSPPPPPPNTFSPPRTFSPYDQDRDSPPIRDRMYNLYDNDNNYRHRSPPPFAPLPPPHTDQVKDWENRQSFRPIDQQRPTNRSKTNLNSNEFV